MIARIYRVVNAGDLPLLVDQDANPLRMAGIQTVTGAVGHPKRALSIAQERKVEIVLFGEGGVLFNGVEACPQHYDALVFEIAQLVAEPATLDGSARGIGFGIEPQQDLASAEVLE